MQKHLSNVGESDFVLVRRAAPKGPALTEQIEVRDSKEEYPQEVPRSLKGIGAKLGLASPMQGKTMPFTLRSAQNLSTTVTTGVINQSVTVANVASLPEFADLAGLFDEFFVKRLKLSYQPVSRYAPQFISSATAVGPASVPLGLASLFHGAPAYATIAAQTENKTFEYAHSGDPWTYSWRNNEKSKSTVLVASSTSSALPSQGWCLTSATPAALYTGFAQVLGAAATGFATATVVGVLVIEYDCLFRARA